MGFQTMGVARSASRARELKEDLRCCPSCLDALCVDAKGRDRVYLGCWEGNVLDGRTRRACVVAVVGGMMENGWCQLMGAYRTSLTCYPASKGMGNQSLVGVYWWMMVSSSSQCR